MLVRAACSLILTLAGPLLLCASALAQSCGPTNPNCVVPTRPLADSTNAAASTAFVDESIVANFAMGSHAGTMPTTFDLNNLTITGNAIRLKNGAFTLSGDGAVDMAACSVNGVACNTAVAPATTALNAAIASAISAGQPTLTLLPGTYSVAKTTASIDGSAVAVLINAPGNFTLDGQGSILSLSGADVSSYANIIEAQSAVPGSTFTLKNLTLQYATPPFAQAELSSKAGCVGNNGSATFAMQSGFAPAWASVLRIDQHNPTTGLIVANVYDSISSSMAMTNLGSGNYSLAFNGSAQCTALGAMKVGGSYVLMNTQFGYEGIRFEQMANIVLDNVKVIDAAGHGVLVIGANNITLKNGSAIIAAVGAWRSTNAGGFAFVYTSGIVTVDPSTQALWTGDDSLFIGPYQNAITTVTSLTSIVTPGVFPGTFIVVGDTIQFVDENGVKQGTATVSSLTTTPDRNTILTLASPGAPSGVATSWRIADQSQAPSLCTISGAYGNSPTRAIQAGCVNTIFNQPSASNTGAAGIMVQYNLGKIGIVPTSITFNQPVLINNNYGNDAESGSIGVEGWNIADSAPATAGQIGSVVVNNPNCTNAGSSCVYIGSAHTVMLINGTNNYWYGRAAKPGIYQPGCSLYNYALALCNDDSVIYGGNYFLSSGSRLGFSGVTALASNSPQFIGGNEPNGTLTSNSTNYFTTFIDQHELSVGVPILTSGRFRNLNVLLSQDPGNGITVQVTARANQAGSTVTCTITGNGSTATTCSDTAHLQAIASGQLWDFKVVVTGSVAADTTITADMLFDCP
jgi:hypothetical protein